ncbi:unnamed protein product, partial [marine sediment metagenome]
FETRDINDFRSIMTVIDTLIEERMLSSAKIELELLEKD